MAKRFSWLDRGKKETVRAYDNRINHLAAFHAGYAFLSLINYYEEYSAFAVYTVWNGECNAKLSSALPEGGFMMHCDRAAAEEMSAMGHGFPVFIKLYAKLGMLYVERLALADRDRLYDLYFNGCEVIPPEDMVYRPQLLPEDPAQNAEMEAGAKGQAAAGSFGRRRPGGSYHKGSFYKGSYRSGSYTKGSLWMSSYFHGSYLQGSYRTGSYRGIAYGQGSGGKWGLGVGSFRYGGALSGSYLSWLFAGTSYRRPLFGGSFYQGSYRFGNMALWGGGSFASSFRSWMAGGSYLGSSYHGGLSSFYFMTGSYFRGSYRKGSFVCSVFSDAAQVRFLPQTAAEEGKEQAVDERFLLCRLIEELGYGLDLI